MGATSLSNMNSATVAGPTSLNNIIASGNSFCNPYSPRVGKWMCCVSSGGGDSCKGEGQLRSWHSRCGRNALLLAIHLHLHLHPLLLLLLVKQRNGQGHAVCCGDGEVRC